MLQRAASNAYSWWWASHIRTKQSKWLEQNLQDMEEKVEIVLKLIEEDGDSFAKRAEMYYKKRPELISFVEESYRAYRALAERYDHISTELQNANNTIASVFPEQVQFAIDEEDENASNGVLKKASEVSKSNVPIAPKGPIAKEFKRNATMETSATKSLTRKKTMKGITGAGVTTSASVAKSGLNKPEAMDEIDRLQKQILALQTEKEFVKSSYENGVAKYWEIESSIKEMQERVSSLHDEFGEGILIDDNEARNLMAGAVLKSCQEKLALLQEKQERSNEEAVLESQRIKEVRGKLESLKNGSCDRVDEKTEDHVSEGIDQEVSCGTSEKEKLDTLREKIKQQFEVKSNSDFTVTEMVEKVDELVNKVISLETAVSSQAALVERLKSETDELQAQLRSLESDKAELITDGNLKLKEMEEKLDGIRVLDKSFKDQNNNLQMHFTEANCNLDHLSNNLQSIKPDGEENTVAGSSEIGLGFVAELDFMTQLEAQQDIVNPFINFPSNRNPFEDFEEVQAVDSEAKPIMGTSDFDQQGDFLQPKEVQRHIGLDDLGSKEEMKPEPEESKEDQKLVDVDDSGPNEEAKIEVEKSKEENQKMASLDDLETKEEVEESKEENQKPTGLDDLGPKEEAEESKEENQKPTGVDDLGPKEESKREAEDELDWQKLFTDGMENREKTLLSEYTTTLRNYKDVKKRLGEAEKKNRDGIFEAVIQMKELKSVNAKKDEEIRSLRLKLGLLEDSLNETSDTGPQQQHKDEDEDEKEEEEEEEEERGMSETEEKFRTKIDEVLEQNLEFWLRFSSSFHAIQKFDTEVEDLKSEIERLHEKRRLDEKSNSLRNLLRSDARPLYKHLREIQTELGLWLEKSGVLRDELEFRFGSLCEIQEEITKELKASAEGDGFESEFTSYQAAKFRGEVLNMKQENNKVADELRAALDHVSAMQLDVERTLLSLNDDFELAGPTNPNPNANAKKDLRHASSTTSRSRIPLRSFIFGVRSKKQKASIFAFVAPAISRKYHGTKSGPIL